MSTLYLTQIIISPKHSKSPKAKSHPKRQVSSTVKTDNQSHSLETKHTKTNNSNTFNNKNKVKSQDISKFNSSIKKGLENDYLHFLMDTQLKYADINSIEQHYQTQIIKYHNQFNTNLHLIKSKNDENNKLKFAIETLLLTTYVLDKEILEQHYNTTINEIKHAIRTYEHNLQVYSHLKNRLHHQQFMIKKRIDTELRTDIKNSQQLNQFQMLQILAKSSDKDQVTTMKKLKAIDSHSQRQYIAKEIEKTKQINALQYEIEMLKRDSEEYEKNLMIIKERNYELSQLVERHSEENKMVNNDYLSIKKEYYESKIKINLIMTYLKVKTIDDLIYKFNIHNDTYKHFKNGYTFTNHELISLYSYYSQLENRLNEIQSQIELEKQTKIPRSSYNDQEIINKEKILTSNTFTNNELSKFVETKRCLCERVLFYMSDLIVHTFHTIPRLKQHLMLNSYENIINNDLTILNELTTDNIRHSVIIFRQFAMCFFYLLSTSISNELANNNQQDTSNNNSYTTRHNNQGINIVQLFTRKNINILYKEIERVKEYYEMKMNLLKKSEMDILKNLNINSNDSNTEMMSTDGLSKSKENKMKTKGKVSQTVMLSRFISYMKVQQQNSISLKKARNEYVSHEEESNAENVKSRFIEGHERQIKNVFSKFQNDLVYQDKNPDDYKTFYITKSSNFNSNRNNINLPKTKEAHTTTNKINLRKSIFNSEQTILIPKQQQQPKDDSEWQPDSDELRMHKKVKSQNTFTNTNLHKNNYKGKSNMFYKTKSISHKKTNYTFYKDDIDKQNIFLRRGELRKLEMTYVKGLTCKNNNNKAQIEVKDEKGNKRNINDVYYEYIRKYGSHSTKGGDNKISTMNLFKFNKITLSKENGRRKSLSKHISMQSSNHNEEEEKDKENEKENKKIKNILENQITKGGKLKHSISNDNVIDNKSKAKRTFFPKIKN